MTTPQNGQPGAPGDVSPPRRCGQLLLSRLPPARPALALTLPDRTGRYPSPQRHVVLVRARPGSARNTWEPCGGACARVCVCPRPDTGLRSSETCAQKAECARGQGWGITLVQTRASAEASVTVWWTHSNHGRLPRRQRCHTGAAWPRSPLTASMWGGEPDW